MSKDFWNDNMPPGYYDKILKDGLQKSRGIQANWHNITFTKIQKLIQPNDKHLDYACGPGTFIGLYLYKNSQGVDISDGQIQFAKNNYGDKGKFITVTDFLESNEEKKYDKITVLGLLEFLEDEDNFEILKNLYNRLNKNGQLLLTTPNYRSFMYILEKILNRFGEVGYKNQHINRFTVPSVKKFMNDSNFQNVKVSKFLNFGIVFSILSISFGQYIEELIERIFNGFFGYLLLIKITK